MQPIAVRSASDQATDYDARMLVTAQSLFNDYFLPLYPAEAAANLVAARANDANPAKNRAIFAQLTDAARVFVDSSAGVLGKNLELDFSPASVHRLGAAVTRTRRDAWMQADAGSPKSELFNVVVHGSAYVGECVVRAGGTWRARNPLWESVVRLQSRSGDGELAVFHWWLKSLDDDAFDASGAPRFGLAERFRTHVEIANGPGDLPMLAESSRALPKISKGVRYDVLHKYLVAHLPELRDLGADFPSPERFAAYAFEWLDFRLVGEGRMLVMFGKGEGGLHVFWLGKDGFHKSALFASDASFEPSVESSGELLRMHVSHDGVASDREVMWWGP